MQTNWRLIIDAPQSGAWNMAVDEAILLAHSRDLAPPTLRFYSWNPFCLSLGRLQKQLPEAAIQQGEGYDVVRRPTGGRSVWHSQEITYSAIVREDLLPAGSRSVEGAYRWLSEGFLRGLQSLGLPVEMAPTGVRTNGSNCFAASASCDFLANGKKLIGAAQCRKDNAILQHGSLLLSIKDDEWQHFAGGPMNGATSLEALGIKHDRETIVTALSTGFASVAVGKWSQDSLTEIETQMAETLCREKYSRESWTLRAQLEPDASEILPNGLLTASL